LALPTTYQHLTDLIDFWAKGKHLLFDMHMRTPMRDMLRSQTFGNGVDLWLKSALMVELTFNLSQLLSPIV
jgi:hypothetical protein